HRFAVHWFTYRAQFAGLNRLNQPRTSNSTAQAHVRGSWKADVCAVGVIRREGGLGAGYKREIRETATEPLQVQNGPASGLQALQSLIKHCPFLIHIMKPSASLAQL